MVLDLSNTIFSEKVRLYPDSTSTGNYHYITNTQEEGYESVEDFKVKFQDIHSNLSSSNINKFRPPGQGPINVLFELKDKIYAARDTDGGASCKLYTTTDLEDLSKDVEWEEVDMGYEVPFDGGTSESYTVYDREFLDISASTPSPQLNLLGSSATSINNSESEDDRNWTTTSGVLTENESTAAYSSIYTDFSDDKDVWRSTQTLRVTGFGVGDNRNLRDPIVGIQAKVNYKFSVDFAGSLSQYISARMSSATLTGVGTTSNYADTTTYTGDSGFDTWHEVTLGGTTDDWGATNFSNNRMFEDSFGLDLIFECKEDAGSGIIYGYYTRFYVSYVILSVYYESGNERIYFWDGSTDVSEADLINIFKRDGFFDVGTAEGVLTVYDVTDANAISDNDEIRTGSGGTGALIGKVNGSIAEATLPTSSEIKEEDAFPETIKANFYLDSSKEAVYGVTGGGPSFVYDGNYFINNRVPIPEEIDKPRHITKHADHLVLSFNSGSIIVSVLGQPLNFSGIDGASEWGFGDKITGLMPLKGNALGILCEQSSYALVGTNIDNFSVQIISSSAGAIEYSSANIGIPVFADYAGIASISSIAQYGDFNYNKLSFSIGPFINNRLQDVCGICANVRDIVTAIKIRNNAQYKLFFNDGLILTMSLVDNEGLMPMFTLQNYEYTEEDKDLIERQYVPTAALSTVLSNNKELVMIGNSRGDIYVVQEGTGIIESSGIREYDCYLVFNPFNGDAPIMNLKYNEIHVHGTHSGHTELTGSAGVNYLEPNPDTTKDTVVMGDLENAMNLGKIPNKAVFHLPSVTAGYSLRIDTVADGDIPHTIQALTYRVAPSSLKNAAPRNY